MYKFNKLQKIEKNSVKPLDRSIKKWYHVYAVLKRHAKNQKTEGKNQTMKNPNFKKDLIRYTRTADLYYIENYDGMTDEEIIDACDPNNFGGYVDRQSGCCKVYTD